MDAAATSEAFRQIQVYLFAAALALSRMIGMMTVMPVFTRLGINGLVRNGIGLVLALPMVPMIAAAIEGQQLTTGIIAALLFKEATVGVIIGLVAGLPLVAAEFAGDVLDLQRGSSGAFLSDPSGAQASVTGALFALVMMALYFGSGCFSLTLRAVYESYDIWPVRRFVPLFSREAGDLYLHLLDTVFTMGVVLVMPVMVCLLLVDLLFALVSRAAPQLQVFFLSLTAKNLIFSVLLVLYSAYLVSYMKSDLAVLLETNLRLRAIGTDSRPQ
jgi:type III secretion protein T